MNRKLIFIAWFAVAVSRSLAVAQDASARTIQYHSQDIVPIHAKLKYTTLIQVPPTEKIMEAATGDKDFWIVDVVGNFCFVHPAKAGISSNLNLITDKGNIYSFTLQDVSGTSDTPDLKVLIEPADRSSIVAANGPPQFVPAVQLEQTRQQLAALQSHVEQAVDEYKSAYPVQLKFDYTYKSNEGTPPTNAMVDGFGVCEGRLLCHLGGVGDRCEVCQILDGAVGQTRQHGGQVLADGHAQLAAAFHDGENSRYLGTSFLAADLQPVAPSDCYGPH
jgi:type IV secretion system protein VirB9